MPQAKAKTKPRPRPRRTSASAKRGHDIRRKLYGAEDVDGRMAEIEGESFINTFFDFTHEVCFDQLWGRKGLPDKARSMVTLAIVAAKNEAVGVRRHVGSGMGS